jgi:hypothetical protein
MSIQRLQEQRAKLATSIHHARLQDSHCPSEATARKLRSLTLSLRRLDDVLLAIRHGKLSLSAYYEPSTDAFVTQREIDSRKRLNQDRRVVYL